MAKYLRRTDLGLKLEAGIEGRVFRGSEEEHPFESQKILIENFFFRA